MEMAEIAPACSTCRLIGTSKIEDEIEIILLDYQEGFKYFTLSETENQKDEIQSYVYGLLPGILAGNFQITLAKVEEGVLN